MYNPKPREVYCRKCKEYTIDDRANPKCLKCNEKLFTVIKSLITGLAITGSK
jgi:Zn finger protein HypA/HybF involved in hydrogenase expression